MRLRTWKTYFEKLLESLGGEEYSSLDEIREYKFYHKIASPK